jgi:hypothetical protein
MGEGGQNAPVCLTWPNNSPSRTSEQEPARLLVPSLNASRLRPLKTVRKSLRGFFDRPSLPKLGSVAKYHDRIRRELTRATRRAFAMPYDVGAVVSRTAGVRTAATWVGSG